jgi:hypothetical protein
MSIFKTQRDKQEFVRIFREKTMSGFLDKDKAIDLIIRDYPHLFYQPTEAELLQSSRSEMNDAMRAGVQSNRLAYDIFRRPADKPS